MKHHHLVQLAAGTDPRLNQKEFLMKQAYQRILQKLADAIDLDQDSAEQAMAYLDHYSQQLTGMSLYNLLKSRNADVATLGYSEAGGLLMQRGITLTGRPIAQDLINKLTTHTVSNIQFLTDDMQDQLSTQLKQGYAAGEGIPDLRDRVMSVLDISKNKATRDARTMTNEVYNQAHIARYVDAGIPGVQFSAANNETTCEICGGELDGTIWDINDPDIVRPPVHPNCRCRLIPWLQALPADVGQVDGDVMDFYQNFREKYFPVPLYA